MRDRFSKVALLGNPRFNPRNFAGIIRYLDGTFAVLDMGEFAKLTGSWPPLDATIVAIQPWVPGHGKEGLVYRNSYSIADDKGRLKTSTHVYPALPPPSTSKSAAATAPSSTTDEDSAADGGESVIHRVPPNKISATKLVASTMCTSFDAATKQLVRFVEEVKKVRILRIWADYFIDSNSQMWFAHCGGIVVASGAAAVDLRSISSRDPQSLIHATSAVATGRSGFLGKAGAVMEQEELEKVQHISPSPLKRKSHAEQAKRAQELEQTNKLYEQQILEASKTTENYGSVQGKDITESEKKERQKSLIVPHFEPSYRSHSSSLPSVPPPRPNSQGETRRQLAKSSLSSPTSPKHRMMHHAGKSLPTQFKCHGQFCDLRTVDPAPLQSVEDDKGSNRERALRIAKQVLSVNELKNLEASGKLLQLGITKRDPLAYKSVSQKSITLAADENRKIHRMHDDRDSWMHYPDDAPISVVPKDTSPKRVSMPVIESPSSAKKNAQTGVNSQTFSEQQKHLRREARTLGVTAPTATSSGRANWGQARGEVKGGAANFYKEVKVCGVCAQVYGLLDQSRELLYLEEEKKIEEEKIKQLSDYVDHRKAPRTHQPGDVADDENSDSMGIMATELGRQLFSVSLQNPLGLDSKTMPPQMEAIQEGGGDDIDTTFLSPVKTKNGKQQFSNSVRSPSLGKPRATWKEHLADDEDIGEHHKAQIGASGAKKKKGKGKQHGKQPSKVPKPSGAQQALAKGNNPHFEVLDDYLKGTGRLQHSVESRKKEQLTTGKETQSRLNHESNRYHAKILIGDPDKPNAMKAKETLEPSGYIINWVENGADCIEMMQSTHYDAILVAKDMAIMNSFDVTKWIRDREKVMRIENAKRRAQLTTTSKGFTKTTKSDLQNEDPNIKPDLPPMPVIIYTDEVKPEDLQLYMEAGMDGCVSKPLHPPSLVSTFKAAIPDHLSPLLDVLEARGESSSRSPNDQFEPRYGPKTRIKPRAFISGAMGTIQGDDGSSAMVANTLAISASFSKEDFSKGGIIQYDSDTKFPYVVLDSTQHGTDNAGTKMFNMVVCHDIFDTCERLRIMLKEIIVRYPGIQILLWNYPGQAFTEFREGQTLNNDYHAGCLYELLEHVGPNGTNQFNTQKPYYLMGYGNGASIASFFAAHYKTPFLRSLLFFNGFSFVDPHYAAIMHDCMNVFSCSPDTRPDLPVYFYARFIFSPSYLSQVSTPLALNLYTAVHNPISTHGRIQLCLGALSHVDVRPFLKEISTPIITVHGTQAGLAKAFHAQPFVESRPGGEARSIYQCLKAQKKQTCVIWVKGGHELFQEQRKNVTTLIEQLLTGYHELNDVAFMTEQTVEPGGAIDMGPGGSQNVPLGGSQSGKNGENFEDQFINDLVGHVNAATSLKRKQDKESKKKMDDAKRWDKFREDKRQDMHKQNKQEQLLSNSKKEDSSRRKEAALDEFNMPGTVTDPSHPSFERQDNIVYKAGNSLMYPNPEQFPEVKEYMNWRLKRNKKRLVRLEHAAKVVQGAFRAHLAWIIVKRLREESAAENIQRVYRGFLGRLEFLQRMKELWAAQLIQVSLNKNTRLFATRCIAVPATCSFSSHPVYRCSVPLGDTLAEPSSKSSAFSLAPKLKLRGFGEAPWQDGTRRSLLPCATRPRR